MKPAVTATPLPAGIRSKTSIVMAFTFVLWLVVVVGATIQMTQFSNSPGSSGPPPILWPAGGQISLNASKPTLVMFAHPRCPCTRASLGELDVLLAQIPEQLSVHVVFLRSANTATDWEKTDLWGKASSIPGVTVYTDNAGIEARRFHAETSGQTLLYDTSGKLRFQGGITLARGHAGDNSGRSALQELVRKGHANQVKTPVFGCSLFESQCHEGGVICKP